MTGFQISVWFLLSVRFHGEQGKDEEAQADKPNTRNKPIKPTSETRPLLGITMGDPAGIGPEVIAKALAGVKVRRLCRPLVIGSFPVMQQTVKSLKLKMNVIRVEGHEAVPPRSNHLAVLDPLDHPLGQFPRWSCGG